MKKIILSTITILMLCNLVFSQITTTKVFEKNDEITNEPYDSLENFLGKDVYKYIGQELYLKGKSERLRKYGYDGFVKDYTKDKYTNKSNVYKCCSGFNSKYDELNGKYFKVLDVMNHPKAKQNELVYGSKFYLKLEEKESGDTVYYQYDSEYKYSFPFVSVGYFGKAKTSYIGTEYVLRGRNWVDNKTEMYDIQNGKPVDYSAGTIWKCVDFAIEEKYYELSLILENNKEERLALGMDNILKGLYYFSKTDADKYKQKFGDENWNLILNYKVRIGMTKEMCELSWGKPNDINSTISSGIISEQWVYDENYLYFDNDILKTIQ